MQLIKIIYESACKAMIRFWDNRFVKDTSVEYYRMEIEKLRFENKELQDKLFNILMPKPPVAMDETPVDWKPMNSYIPWHVKRQQLEQASLSKARELASEAISSMRPKTTEELEKAVGI